MICIEGGVIIETINLSKTNIEYRLKLDTLLLEDLKNKFTIYEQKLFYDLSAKNFTRCKDHLTDFCFELLEFEERDQVYVARLFFKSVIIGIMKKQALKEQLHPVILAKTFNITDRIDTLKNITDYLLYIPQFVSSIEQHVLKNHLFMEHNEHMGNILQLIDDYLTDENLTVEWLAKQVSLSTTHINNLFKTHVDMTIGDYILERKINEIAYELMTTSLPIEQIYKKYGFVNQSHFIQRFKRVKGITPLQYRKRYYY